MTLFRALKNRLFAFLWLGQTISRVGDHLYQIALAWWVLEKTGSAVAMGMVLIFSFTPMVLFLLIGGVAVDRLPRIPLMLGSDLLRGIISTAVTVLAFSNRLELWHVYVASVVFGFVDAFFQPAYVALVPQVVAEADLPSANSLTSFGVQGGRIIGPALGAGLIAAGGTSLAFAIDSASFFISTACLLPLLRQHFPRPTPEQTSGILHDVRTGMRTVLASPWIWITILVSTLTNVTLGGPYNISLPFLIKQNFGGDVRVLGLLYATFPLGYLIGGIWLGRMTRIRRRGILAYGGSLIAGMGMLALGLPIPLIGLLIAALLNGAALEVFSLIWTNTLQQQVPSEQLGRVASIDMVGSFALLPVGYALAGWATDQVGAANVCIAGGALTILFTAAGLFHPAIRQLD
jgi:MFS family permease